MPEEGFDLGNAYGKVIIDGSGVKLSMDQARNVFANGIQAIGSHITSLGDQMSRLGSNLTVLTAPITAFGVAGVKAAMDFDSALVEIQARTGATVDEMEQVRQKSLQIGQDTAFSAGQAASAFLQLLTTGQSLDEAMATIDQVMAGAAASGADLGYTADALTDIMAAFGLEASKSGEVMDALAQASGVSSATMTDLIMGFQNVSGVARSFGLSVGDTAAILATFSENGIKGAEAGTALRSMLNNMTRDTADVTGMWEQLGISMFDATGNARPLATVMSELRVKLAAMTDEERINTIKTLGGTFGQLGLSALTTGDGFDVMLDKMEGAATATDVADARMNTFKGSIMFLRGSIETLQIKALTPLMNNVLAPLIQHLSGVVNAVGEWIDANPELAATITTVLAGVSAAGPVLLIAGKALSAIGGIVSLLLSPIGLLATAVAGLAWAFETNFLGIRDTVQPILQYLQDAFQLLSTGDFVGGMFGGAYEDSPIVSFLLGIRDTVINQVIPGLQALAAWFITDALPAVVNFIQTTVIPAVEGVFNFLAGVWELVGPALEKLANWFLNEALPSAVNFIQNTVIPAVERFVGLLVNFWNDIQPGVNAFVNWVLNEGLPMVVDFFNNVIVPAIDTFIGILAGVWETISPALTSLFNWFMIEGLPLIKDFIETVVTPIVKTLVDIIGTVWEVVQPALQSLFDWFTEKGLPLIQAALELVVGVAQKFVDLLVGIWETVKPYVEGLRDGLKAIFDWIIENVFDPVTEAIGNIITAVQDALDAISSLDRTGQGAGGLFGSGIGPDFDPLGGIRGRDSGGSGMAGMPYLIGKGAQPELFVPQENGTFIPNADRLLGGDTTTVGDIYVQMPAEALQSPTIAEARGKDFGAAIKLELRRKGVL